MGERSGIAADESQLLKRHNNNTHFIDDISSHHSYGVDSATRRGFAPMASWRYFSTIAKQVISARNGDREDREVRDGKNLESARSVLWRAFREYSASYWSTVCMSLDWYLE